MSDTPASAEVLINFYGRDKSLACVCGSAPSVSYYSWLRGKMKKIKPKRLRLHFLYLSFPLSLSLSLAETMFQSRAGKTRLKSTATAVVRQVPVDGYGRFSSHRHAVLYQFSQISFFRTKTVKGVLYNTVRIHYKYTIFFNSKMCSFDVNYISLRTII